VKFPWHVPLINQHPFAKEQVVIVVNKPHLVGLVNCPTQALLTHVQLPIKKQVTLSVILKQLEGIVSCDVGEIVERQYPQLQPTVKQVSIDEKLAH
jgi:hypothetical protein